MLKDATVAIEDGRFYQHEGVDYEGVVRAGVQNLVNQKTVQGGSTITMQLVRNLYISSERTYQRKIREAKLAEEIENEHSKHWILDNYLNTVPYGTVGGQSAIGAKAAARIYFNKRARPADAARGRAAGRPPAGAVAVLAAAQPGRRQGAPQRGPARDGALGMISRRPPSAPCAAASGSSPRPTSPAAARATSSTTSRTS